MSRAIFDAPITLPFSLRIGETVSETGIERAVLPAANRLVVFDALAAPDARQDLVLLLLPIVGNEAADRLAHHLGRGVPNIASAAAFHDVTMPFKSLLTIASSLESTIAASRSGIALEVRLRLRSRAIFEAPTISPVAERIGETVREIGTSVPSLRTPDGLEVVDDLAPPHAFST